ncbi:MAG: hypothetical protein QOC94_3448, partial [Actinoplanes sp.]|nr:hypothetical protein [Actinoplanes sp.]
RLPGWLAVTAEDIAEVAAQTLDPSSRVTLTYLPSSPASSTASSEENAR